MLDVVAPIHSPQEEASGRLRRSDLDARVIEAARQTGNPQGIERFVSLLYGDTRFKGIVRSVIGELHLYAKTEAFDELLQRTIVTLHEKLTNQSLLITEPAGIYSLLYGFVHNIAREIQREVNREIATDFSDSENEGYQEWLEAQASAHCTIEDIDADLSRRATAARFDRLFEQAGQGTECALHKRVADPPARVTKRPSPGRPTLEQIKQRGPRPTSKEHQEVAVLVRDSGLTVRDFAKRVGLAHERLASYVYGKTKTVNPEALQAIRALSRALDEQMSEAQRALLHTPMPEVLEGWCRKLDMDTHALCQFLDISQSTLIRWQRGSRPSRGALLQYDHSVTRRSLRR